jgi:LysM repeat protein
MDNEDFDQYSSRHIDYLDSSPSPERRSRRDRGHSGLFGRQIAFIVAVNAALSVVISLIVVRCAAPAAVVIESEPPLPTATTLAKASATQVRDATPANPSGVQATPTSGASEAGAEGATSAPAPAVDTVGETALPSPAGPSEPTTYIVQPGDTLSTIAAKFKVSQEDLMRANGIDNPDYLMLGQKLIVPIGGMPIVTPTFTPAPIPTDTPISFEPPTPFPPGFTPPAVPVATVPAMPTAVPTLTPVPASDVRMTLEVLSPDDPVKEMVYIVNRGLYVRLTGWTLSNGRGAVYTFPDLGLGGNGAAVNVHTGSGTNTATDLYWGRPATAWSTGDTATLQDAEGKVIVTYTVGGPAPTP